MYQRCLAIELEKHGIEFVREPSILIYYENVHVGMRRAGIIVASELVLQLKAVICMEHTHLV
ncbi:MAG: GxxExxY protein [Mangrovibacterium sp.]